MKHLQTLAGLSAAFALTGMAFAGDGGSAATLSEFRLDMPGADTEEYVELAGTPGTSLDGLSFVIIGDGTGGSGVVETAVDLTGQVINANGFFVLAKSTFTLGVADLVDDSMSFENSDNVTYMLVAGFGNAVGDDLDTDDSGDLESLVGSVVDSLSIIENTDVPASGEFYYGSQEIGPDGTFVPGAGRLCPALGGWVISGFDPAAGDDTPGAANYCPIPGDTCADAIAIGVGATAFDTTGLSDSGFHDGSCVSRDGFTDIWYVFTAATDGDHVIDTCGADIDTVLRVFDSADCATAVCLAGNDDACNMSTGAGFASSLTATLVAGQSYLIQMEGWGSSDIGAGTLTIAEPAVPGDLCADAIPVAAGATAFDTTGLSDSGFHDGSCVGRDGFTDIWYVFTAGISGDHVLDTCGADIDTVLRIFDGADCATAVCLAGNDDACNMSTGAGFASSLTATLVAGQSYLIQIEGWGSSDIGAGTLTITEPSLDTGDDCGQALPAVVGANAFDTTGLIDSGFHDGSCVSRDGFTDIWFVYTAGIDGDHVLDTCGADIDTVLRIFDSADCATAVCLAGNDDACAMSTGAGFASSLTATLVAGQSYLIQIEGWGSSDIGAGTLTITEPSACDGNDDLFTQIFSNGDCANASPLTNGYYTGLTVCQDRLDFYTFAVANGATLDAQIQFDQATADLDMFLYDAATCNSDPADPGCSGSLACGYSASSNETISWTNTTGADAVVTLRVNIWANNSADIATYDMSISGIAASSVSVVCTPPNANSTGGAVTIGASNSGFFTSGGAPLTWLNATGGPDGEFGYFLVSATYAEPGVSVADGLLCLTGGIGRYNAEAGNANSLRNSTGTFVASATGGLSVFQCANGLTIGGDATGFNVPDQLPWIAGSSIPAPNIQPGDSFTFQMWYRDGASSNFSDAVSVQF
jgi:hypothetical protein